MYQDEQVCFANRHLSLMLTASSSLSLGLNISALVCDIFSRTLECFCCCLFLGTLVSSPPSLINGFSAENKAKDKQDFNSVNISS